MTVRVLAGAVVLVLTLTFSAGCKPACPEGKKLFVWSTAGVTHTQCINR